MKTPIRKAVIAVAGLGTRFLPATKAMPKEMLPLIDKPILQHIVEEAVASGITDIIFVTSYAKRACEDHFDASPELENLLRDNPSKKHLYDEVVRISKLANFVYIRQKGPYGNGVPVMNVEHLIGDEPFVVLFGDDVFDCPNVPRIKQMMDVYDKYQDPVLAGYKIPRELTNRYGVIGGVEVENGVYQVNEYIEKPAPEDAPSDIAIIGAYLLTPEIFSHLKNTKAGKDGEIWLVDGIRSLMKERAVYAKAIEGTYYDTGSKIGWLKANIHFGLKHPETKDEIKTYLKSLSL